MDRLGRRSPSPPRSSILAVRVNRGPSLLIAATLLLPQSSPTSWLGSSATQPRSGAERRRSAQWCGVH